MYLYEGCYAKNMHFERRLKILVIYKKYLIIHILTYFFQNFSMAVNKFICPDLNIDFGDNFMVLRIFY